MGLIESKHAATMWGGQILDPFDQTEPGPAGTCRARPGCNYNPGGRRTMVPREARLNIHKSLGCPDRSSSKDPARASPVTEDWETEWAGRF
jgi:hypothetical protein